MKSHKLNGLNNDSNDEIRNSTDICVSIFSSGSNP